MPIEMNGSAANNNLLLARFCLISTKILAETIAQFRELKVIRAEYDMKRKVEGQLADDAEATANAYCVDMWKRLENIARMPARTIKGVEAKVKAFRRFGVLFTDTRNIGSQDADEWAAATLLADIKALAAQVQA